MYEFLSYNFYEETQEAVSTAIRSYNYVHYTIRAQWNRTKQSSISTIQGIIHVLTSLYNSRRKKVSSCQIMYFVYVHISTTSVSVISRHIAYSHLFYSTMCIISIHRCSVKTIVILKIIISFVPLKFMLAFVRHLFSTSTYILQHLSLRPNYALKFHFPFVHPRIPSAIVSNNACNRHSKTMRHGI